MFGGTGQRFRLFRLFGFPLYVEPSIFILILLYLFIGSTGGPEGTIRALVFCLVAFLSIIIHELGHALTIRKLGYGQSTIVLHGLGGICQWRGTPTRKHRILIALAGPGASLIIGLVLWLGVVVPFGYPKETLSSAALWAAVWVNLIWSGFNLLPIWPLDGGHVVRYALVSKRRSRHQTLELSLKISMVAAGVMIALGLWLNSIFVSVLLGFILYSNYKEWRQTQGPPSSFYGY